MQIDDEAADVWPDVINAFIQPPRMVMDLTLAGLENKTNRLLKSSSYTTKANDLAIHTFSVIAPALNDFEQELVRIRHQLDVYYPCFVSTSSPDNVIASELNLNYEPGKGIRAANDQELKQILKKVVNSKDVTTLLVSLLARSNELYVGTSRT